MLLYGSGCVPQGYEEAEEWYAMAANQGHAGAEREMGNSYSHLYYDNSLSQDYDKAVEWYTKALKRGSITAQRKLKEIHEKGLA